MISTTSWAQSPTFWKFKFNRFPVYNWAYINCSSIWYAVDVALSLQKKPCNIFPICHIMETHILFALAHKRRQLTNLKKFFINKFSPSPVNNLPMNRESEEWKKYNKKMWKCIDTKNCFYHFWYFSILFMTDMTKRHKKYKLLIYFVFNVTQSNNKKKITEKTKERNVLSCISVRHTYTLYGWLYTIQYKQGSVQ